MTDTDEPRLRTLIADDEPLALGMLRADLAVAGTAVEVEIFGQRHPATVLEDAPAWDAKNERLRA